jgi:hypothetical protein
MVGDPNACFDHPSDSEKKIPSPFICGISGAWEKESGQDQAIGQRLAVISPRELSRKRKRIAIGIDCAGRLSS